MTCNDLMTCRTALQRLALALAAAALLAPGKAEAG